MLLFYFQRKSRFHQRRRKSFKKSAIVEVELGYIDTDGIGGLEDLPRLLVINEECGNLKVAAYVGKVTRNIDKKEARNFVSF